MNFNLIIEDRKEYPQQVGNNGLSVYVFIYYKNHKRFCLGRYDYERNIWIDNDGVIIKDDFYWSFLPIKCFKNFINNSDI